jgi:hypothetical protein
LSYEAKGISVAGLYICGDRRRQLVASACVLLKDVFDHSLEEIAQLVDSTVQFYESDNGSWRIKTYATDQDVHAGRSERTLKILCRWRVPNTAKHYGDVLSE